jgi:hypothetical protein
MKNFVLIVVLVLVVCISQAGNLDPTLPHETIARVHNNMADDFARCSAFYKHVSHCLSNTGSDVSTRFEKLSIESLQYAATYLRVSNALTLKTAGQDFDKQKLWEESQDTVFNWYEREHKDMLAESMTCSNLNILYRRYLKSCNTYYQNPDVLRDMWVRNIEAEGNGG